MIIILFDPADDCFTIIVLLSQVEVLIVNHQYKVILIKIVYLIMIIILRFNYD